MSESRKWKGSNTFLSNCLKFNLIKNSKLPSDEWNKNNSNYRTDSHKLQNWGLVCGKVNNCIGLDLDLYNWDDKNPFYEFIGTKDVFKWAKEQNTLCIKTTSNGLHLIYELNNNQLRNINDHKINIDIKTDGGYLVGAGSIVKSKITNNWGEYTIFNNKKLVEMPETLIEWLSTNLSYAKNNKENSKNKTKYKNKTNQEISLNNDINKNYIYNFSENELTEILDNLPEEYILNHDYWINTASAMKSINKVQFFLDYCMNHKKTRCKVKNDDYYNTNAKLINNIKNTENFQMSNMFVKILSLTKIKNASQMLSYKKYKPIIKSDFSKEDIKFINIDKLGKELILEKTKNYVIKSDTGTGKTTLFKKYAAENNLNIISIISRISLGDDQYKSFNEEGIEIYNYRYSKRRFITGENVIITIDSISRLCRMDFKNYVIFLDEFNSLIEYLMTCPNLKKTRCNVFRMLLRILENAQQIIAVDADIHSNSLKILNFCNVKYEFIINNYLHNKSNGEHPVKSREIFEFDDFINQVKVLNEVMIACDSKNDAETIFRLVIEYKFKLLNIDIEIIKETGNIETTNEEGNIIINKYEKRLVYINEYSICLITSDTDEGIDLDKYDYIIFSPKIIYGLDSIRKRPVYAHYKEHTISPRGMIQQIARNRNIEYLRYIFYKKRFTNERYEIFQDVIEENKDLMEMNDFELNCNTQELNLYLDMLNVITYNEDCYRTNKFCHFKLLLQERGFDDETTYAITTKKGIIENNLKTKEEKYEEFNTFEERNSKINEYLKLPIHEIKKYKELFIENNSLERHFKIQNFFFKGLVDWNKSIEDIDGFFNDKMLGSTNKFKYIYRLMKELKLTNKNNINCEIGLSSKKISDKYYNEYKLLFRNRTTEKIDLTNKNECSKFLYKLYSSEFGRYVFNSKRVGSKENRITQYYFNETYINQHRDITVYKFPSIIRGKLDFTFGNEKSLYNRKTPEYLKTKLISQIKKKVKLIL